MLYREGKYYYTPRKSRANPFITCTKGQVGRLPVVSLLPTSTDALLHQWEACNPQQDSGVPYKCCGFKRVRHAPSREFN